MERRDGGGGHDNETTVAGSDDKVERASGGVGLRVGSWANYDGSWNEWGNDESAPIET